MGVLIVALPRLVICSVLVVVASGYIVRSSETDMIIDTVAALFIVDIDEFMYHAFTTSSVKQQMEAMEGLEFMPSNMDRLLSFFFVNFIYPLMIILCAITLVWHQRLDCGD